jgi:hypothetical protein
MVDEELSEGLFLRIAKSDRELLDTLATRMPLKPASIARIALRIGLAELERDPSRILAEGASKTKKTKTSPKK